MILGLLSFFVVLSFLAYGKLTDKKCEVMLLFYFFISLLLFIIFRDGNRCPDYKVYQYYFYTSNLSDYNIEHSFKYIISLLNYFEFSDISLFFFYGIVGFGIKYYLIKKDSYPFVALLGYLSYELLNQEMTAIRAGVATSFLLLAFFLYKRSRLKFYLFGCLGVFFHYSAIFFLLYPLFIRFSTKKWLGLIFLLSLFLPYFTHNSFLIFLDKVDIPYLQEKLSQYVSNANYIATTFRPAVIQRFLLFLFFLHKSKLIEKRNRDIYSNLTVLLIGITLNSLFSFSPIFQYRISSLFFSIEIFLYKNFYFVFRNKMIASSCIVFLCGFNLLYSLFVIEIFGVQT